MYQKADFATHVFITFMYKLLLHLVPPISPGEFNH